MYFLRHALYVIVQEAQPHTKNRLLPMSMKAESVLPTRVKERGSGVIVVMLAGVT